MEGSNKFAGNQHTFSPLSIQRYLRPRLLLQPLRLSRSRDDWWKHWYAARNIQAFWQRRMVLFFGKGKRVSFCLNKNKIPWHFPLWKSHNFGWWEFSTTRCFTLQAIDLRSGEQWGNTPCTSALYLDSNMGASNTSWWWKLKGKTEESHRILKGFQLGGT